MPKKLTKEEINEIREYLLILSNRLYDLRAEKFAEVTRQAEKALGTLIEMIKKS